MMGVKARLRAKKHGNRFDIQQQTSSIEKLKKVSIIHHRALTRNQSPSSIYIDTNFGMINQEITQLVAQKTKGN
jgi:hypothetical protein